ncbi:MAG TPA: hypothetical protein VF889_03095 [Bacteroidota bacterium]
MLRLFIAALLFTSQPLLAQPQEKPHETSSEIPALSEFHTVIFEIWHNAWPAKDTKRLGELLPQIDERVTALTKAELPGILRERKPVWDERLKQLQTAAHDYRLAAESHQEQALLDAAERLHMRYEKLAQAIRPPLKELDAFHADLYMLYHYYMPGDSVAKMKESALALKTKMTALAGASLPPRLKDRKEKFASSRAQLALAVDALVAATRGDDLRAIKETVETVHQRYQALATVLE